MPSPLVRTKLFVPPVRRGLVPRPRLADRLGGEQQPRLTVISGPAGFGKTTLLAAWAEATSASGRPVAWVSLEESEQQAASFWTYVVTALDAAAPGVGAGVLPLLQAATPMEPVIATLLNELGTLPDGVDLVLDDYHLADGPDIAGDVAFLLEHLPPQVHLVISTRADPALPLARLRARGELVEVRAADLRFTLDEVTAYLNDVVGLGLDASAIATLEGRTEGWIAALQLAALSLQGRDDAAGFIAGFAGDDRYVVDYLVEEVLARQSDAVRTFLLDTSILDRLSGSLCDAVTGGSDGRAVLESLERSNLFVVRLDDSATGTATTTCSPTSCVRTCSTSDPETSPACTGAPPSGTTRPASPCRLSGTRSRPATSSVLPTSSSAPSSACCGSARRPPSGAGSMTSRTTWCGGARCSPSASSAR